MITPPRHTLISKLLADSDMPSLSSSDTENMESRTTAEEFVTALSQIQTGKCPGLDEYPITAFVKSFNSLIDGSPFPCTLLEAHISVIPKTGKDPSSCANYRPIYLLNTDLKIHSQILVNRLLPHLPKLVNLDQAGFMPDRVLGQHHKDNAHLTLHEALPCRAPSPVHECKEHLGQAILELHGPGAVGGGSPAQYVEVANGQEKNPI